MRIWPVLFAVALAAGVATASPGTAQEDLPRITGDITDLTDGQALQGDRDEIQDAIDGLQEESGLQLFVLFLESTDSRTAPQFADDTAEANSFGANDVLFVVALTDRTIALSTADNDVSDSEINDIISELDEPLGAGDWAAAVQTVADGLDEAQGGGDGGGGGGIGAGVIILIVLIGGAFLLFVGASLWGKFQEGRTRKEAAEERDRETGELAKRANGLLLETDDALREAQQELGFAQAEFSEADVEPFRAALEQARAELSAAFEVRQRLDDSTPEEPAERRQMLEEVVRRCEQAKALVDEQRKRISSLRDLQRTAPDVLAKLPAQLQAIEARIPQAEAVFGRLQGYADSSWASVRGNVVEARKRIAFAREQVGQGTDALAREDRRRAASLAASAQEAAAQAGALLEAVEHIETSVLEAKTKLQQELAAARADVSGAQRAMSEGRIAGLEGRLAQAEASLQAAEREARSPKPDYLAAYRAATEANSMADEVLAQVREAREQADRAQADLEASLRSAEASYQRAYDFVRSRSGIGREARTRLSEAERRLSAARALRDVDIVKAASEAKEAAGLADAAYSLASSDFDSHDRFRGGGFGGLGGVIFGPIGFPSGGGGWGGTRWGSSGPRRSSGGGFGGIRRSGGGGFGGGRRSGGGRF